MTTQNDRKRGRIMMEMVSKVIFHTFRSFQAISCPFQGYWEPIWASFGPRGKIVTKKVMWPLKITTWRAWFRWERFWPNPIWQFWEKSPKLVIWRPPKKGPKITSFSSTFKIYISFLTIIKSHCNGFYSCLNTREDPASFLSNNIYLVLKGRAICKYMTWKSKPCIISLFFIQSNINLDR